ncbi:two-component regulator propeller domain-containing protein, partial [Acinetobacter baumannii]|nr:two-component regulator propeller domain-containing protein [Acinetobacter baumannii]
TKDGRVWIGTDGGLAYFDDQKEAFHTYQESNSWLIDANGKKRRMPDYNVKSILEDTNGDLLIGTWSTGLLRLRGAAIPFINIL